MRYRSCGRCGMYEIENPFLVTNVSKTLDRHKAAINHPRFPCNKTSLS